MAPRIIDVFTHKMAHDSHISHGNHEFISVERPAPTSAFGCGPNLHSGDPDPMAYDGHTLGTALSGSIPEFTYIGGLLPSLIIGHGQVFRPGNHRQMAYGELTHEMAYGDHILFGKS